MSYKFNGFLYLKLKKDNTKLYEKKGSMKVALKTIFIVSSSILGSQAPVYNCSKMLAFITQINDF